MVDRMFEKIWKDYEMEYSMNKIRNRHIFLL